MDEKLIILMGIVLLSFTSQALSGFGSIIIAVALGSNVYPIKTLLPILVPLDVIINGYLVTRYRSKVDVPLIVKKIFPSMGMGFVAGVILFSLLEGSTLKGMFGVFVVIMSVRELFLTVRRSETREISPITQAAYLALGGGHTGGICLGGTAGGIRGQPVHPGQDRFPKHAGGGLAFDQFRAYRDLRDNASDDGRNNKAFGSDAADGGVGDRHR